jgi:hypothetical protein
MVIILPANGSTLTLQSDSDGWCTAYILFDDMKIRLGAEHQDVIVDGLVSALEGDLKPNTVGQIQEVEVVWILSLAEEHATIYAGDRNGYRILFFEDASGQLIGSVKLTSEDRQHWLSILNAMAE